MLYVAAYPVTERNQPFASVCKNFIMLFSDLLGLENRRPWPVFSFPALLAQSLPAAFI